MGRHEGKVVMIRGAVLPGETVEVTLDREKKDYLTASAIKVLEPSPLTIAPACGYFGSCGGCHLQHAPYELQVKIKEGLLTECLKRMAKTEIALSSPIINDDPWNYRSRGQFKVYGGETGFYRENTRELVSIDECRLMRPEINAYLQKAKPLLKQTGIRELHITYGDRAAALIRTGARSNARADLDRTAAMFLDAGFSGIFIKTGNNKTLKYGSPYADLEFEGLRYTVSPASFFQSNWRLNLAVAKTIKEALGPLKDRRVLDLYAGAGNLSLLLAAEAEITAVEENPDSISDGKRNIKTNDIRGFKFIRSSAEDFRAAHHFDVLILDPPRPGLTKKTMEKVLTMLPERIVYLSCNPSTFARDLKHLLPEYEIESVRMVDFFPQTFHIESLAFLRLRQRSTA